MSLEFVITSMMSVCIGTYWLGFLFGYSLSIVARVFKAVT